TDISRNGATSPTPSGSDGRPQPRSGMDLKRRDWSRPSIDRPRKAAPSVPARSQRRSFMPADSSGMLDIAIIGAAHPHVEYVLSEVVVRTDVRVVAVADHDAARRAELERRTGAPGYADPESLLDAHPIRAAAIFTEFGHRAPIIVKLLRRGIFAIADK